MAGRYSQVSLEDLGDPSGRRVRGHPRKEGQERRIWDEMETQRARMSQQEWGHPQGDGTRGTSIARMSQQEQGHPQGDGTQGSSIPKFQGHPWLSQEPWRAQKLLLEEGGEVLPCPLLAPHLGSQHSDLPRKSNLAWKPLKEEGREIHGISQFLPSGGAEV